MVGAAHVSTERVEARTAEDEETKRAVAVANVADDRVAVGCEELEALKRVAVRHIPANNVRAGAIGDLDSNQISVHRVGIKGVAARPPQNHKALEMVLVRVVAANLVARRIVHYESDAVSQRGVPDDNVSV